MNRIKFVAVVALLLVMAVPAEVFAVSRLGSKWFQVKHRLRVEYDDNIYQTKDDEKDSSKVINEFDIFVQAKLEQTFLSLHYRPQHVYWDDREPDDTTWNHSVDLIFAQEFSPRVTLSLKDTLLIAEQPAQILDGNQFGPDNDYTYNSVVGSLSIGLTPETTLDLSGRYQLLRYDEDAISDANDYDIYVAGLDLRRQVLPETSVALQLRGEQTDYTETDDRDSDSYQAGAALEEAFGPDLVGKVRLGWQHKTFDDSSIDDIDSAYADGSLTLLPSPATRITGGVGYDQSDTDVAPFANQDRFRVYASLAYDVTARITWYLTSEYIMHDLDAEDAPEASRTQGGEELEDGSENITQVSTRLAYKLNRSNVIEAGWQLIDLDSDVREDYVRNRLSLGWRTEI